MHDPARGTNCIYATRSSSIATLSRPESRNAQNLVSWFSGKLLKLLPRDCATQLERQSAAPEEYHLVGNNVIFNVILFDYLTQQFICHLNNYVPLLPSIDCSSVECKLHIKGHAPDWHGPNLRTYTLKRRLETYFHDQIHFVNPPNNRGDLVYSSDLNVSDAVGVAFDATASESRILKEAASTLRRDILNAFRTSPPMEWPPSAAFLQSATILPPQTLSNCVSTVISGKGSNWSERVTRISQSISEGSNWNERVTRISQSISEDIMFSFTHSLTHCCA